MSQRSECPCAGLAEIFSDGGAPAAMVLDNATEAGGTVRGEVAESRLFSQLRVHYRFESRYHDPYSGNEKGSVENAVASCGATFSSPCRRSARSASPIRS